MLANMLALDASVNTMKDQLAGYPKFGNIIQDASALALMAA